MFKIMVVEDDKNAGRLMKTVLEQNGYSVVLASDGQDALDVMDRVKIDLIILDLMLPVMGGYEFLDMIRSQGCDVPVMIVTAKQLPVERKIGFRLGTDDFMVKPVDEEELVLRIKALLRRARISNEHKLVLGGTVLDYDSYTVDSNGVKYDLPGKEFLLIFKLLSYPNKIFTRRQLLDELWDMETDTVERTVDVHVNRLREKFKDNPDFEIVTVRGLGYKAITKHHE
ncbi:MAG: response regulator transcription factor [Clostridia bacterium]|nr:response regulator transcription factor [Clostridia bacterium]